LLLVLQICSITTLLASLKVNRKPLATVRFRLMAGTAACNNVLRARMLRSELCLGVRSGDSVI